MTIGKFFAVMAVTLSMLVAGLTLAYQLDLEWLRIVSLVVPMLLGCTAVMVIKTRAQRQSRSMAEGSVEREIDVRARAGAFVDAIVLAVVALAASAAFPQVANWIILFALLAAIAVAYWVRWAWEGRRAGGE
ncbi:hypothetical protein [Microbacterium sp. NPDC056234]|uniref:hypothetical protein n=1 Tax=Microbacterium sp. NPDC056234 TaxID=3345757 RepID=UPI0035D63A92